MEKLKCIYCDKDIINDNDWWYKNSKDNSCICKEQKCIDKMSYEISLLTPNNRKK